MSVPYLSAIVLGSSLDLGCKTILDHLPYTLCNLYKSFVTEAGSLIKQTLFELLQKKLFLTEETLNESLDEVKDHWVRIHCMHKRYLFHSSHSVVFRYLKQNCTDVVYVEKGVAKAHRLILREGGGGVLYLLFFNI